MNSPQPDVVTAFADVKRDAHGVSPVELQRFVHQRLSEADARETFSAVSRGDLTSGQLAARLGLPTDAFTDVDVSRLRHLLSLWHRWAMDDADGWFTTGASPAAGRAPMNFIDVDLAWGPVKRSGIAVLDADGVLVHVGAALTDDDIVATVTHYLEHDHSVVAIDAPLVVTNPTGMRPVEKEITRDFGPFHAGAFPAALDKFPDPRGTRLVDAMHLDVDPRSTGPRRAIEVYPHPATVALFSLGRTFKYKGKKGRSVETRRAEFLKFMDAIEDLATSSVPMHVTANDDWKRLRRNVEQAERPVDLDRAEDPVDAVMCAYVALYAERRPDDVTIYGDFPANGYILTPTLPLGLRPTPPQPAATKAATAPPLPTAIAAQREHCNGRLATITAAWADIDTQVHELCSAPDSEATEAVVESLTNVRGVLVRAEEQLSTIRDQLRLLTLLIDQ